MPSSAVSLPDGVSALTEVTAAADEAGSAGTERDDVAGRSEEEVKASAVDAFAHIEASPYYGAERQTMAMVAVEEVADPTSAGKRTHTESSVLIQPTTERHWISGEVDPVGSLEVFRGWEIAR